MNTWIPIMSILRKDMQAYYLKPPNISWGIIFPVAWTMMFFIRSGGHVEIGELLPGVMSLSVLFGTTSMLAVTITFEKRSRAFERLLLAPIGLPELLVAKTSGAIIFGIINSAVPLVLGLFLVDLSAANWLMVAAAVFFIAATSTFLGLMIAVSVQEVFEAQTFSNFFRFPMVFLCGLFFPVAHLPLFLRPLSYALPLTYGNDLLRQALWGGGQMQPILSLGMLVFFSIALFVISLHNAKRRWII